MKQPEKRGEGEREYKKKLTDYTYLSTEEHYSINHCYNWFG